MMRFETSSPVLHLGESSIAAINPKDPSSLFGMWSGESLALAAHIFIRSPNFFYRNTNSSCAISVFNRASGIMENGRRLENMSWRVWSQSKFRESHDRQLQAQVTSDALQVPARNDDHDAPALSTSVESAASMESFSTEAVEGDNVHEPLTSDLGILLPGEKEITSDTLQNLVMSIKSNQDLDGPLSPLPSPSNHQLSPTVSNSTDISAPTPRPSSPRQVPVDLSASTIASVTTASTRHSPMTNSDGSSVSPGSDHSIVHGFKPGQKSGISTYRSQSQLAPPPTPIPILKTSASKRSTPKKKVGLFEIGSGDSSEGSVMQEHVSPRSVRENVGSSLKRPAFAKKQTSFKEEVTEIKAKRAAFHISDDEDDGGAIESDTEDEEEVSESAIDDDDEWEDEAEPDDDEPKELTFHRVPSKPELVSRRSMLAEGLNDRERVAGLMRSAASAPRLQRSRTSTPNGPSMPASPSDDSPLAAQGSQPLPVPQAVLPSGFHPPMPPMSPRQTRQAMLMTELGASLRRDMLNERKQRNYIPKRPGKLPGRAVQSSGDMVQLQAQAHAMQLSTPSTRHQPPIIEETTPEIDYFNDNSTNYHERGW